MAEQVLAISDDGTATIQRSLKMGFGTMSINGVEIGSATEIELFYEPETEQLLPPK